MKKKIAWILALALLLTGCSAKTQKQTEASGKPQIEKPVVESQVPTETTAPEETVVPEPTVPETTAPSEPVEETPETPEPAPSEPAQPEEPKEETPPKAEEPKQPAQNSKPQQSTQETKPQQSTQETKPQQTKPQQTKPQQTKPQQTPSSSTPGRKVSSATCKDTGSDKVWENPDADQPDYYEEDDPERTAYLEYLKAEGNEFYYWLMEDTGMRMYLGRTYGMALYTSYEMMIASTWTSSDPSVATVNAVGFVSPLKAGETVITVTYVDPQTQEATSRQCPVRVTEEPVYTYAELEQRAHEEAKQIANYAMENGKTDLEKIAIAAAFINIYVGEGKGGSRYEIVDGELVSVQVPGYNQPFGTLVSFHSTCAGDVRALGLVLEYMGFEWYHVNENQWDHQWCVVYDVDGQTAFADGSMFGIAGYGERKDDRSNWLWYRNGGLVPVQ